MVATRVSFTTRTCKSSWPPYSACVQGMAAWADMAAPDRWQAPACSSPHQPPPGGTPVWMIRSLPPPWAPMPSTRSSHPSRHRPVLLPTTSRSTSQHRRRRCSSRSRLGSSSLSRRPAQGQCQQVQQRQHPQHQHQALSCCDRVLKCTFASWLCCAQ